MDTSPIPGFITRKQASESCKRAERTLQRYWSRAIELGNSDVLNNLKLRTEDAELIDGADVTKELIDDLKKKGKNPTWYVHAAWVEKTYGPRLENEDDPKRDAARPSVEHDAEPSSSTGQEVVSLLKEQIHNLQQDKQDLREEMQIKNEQINQANERDRETHLLMRDLHKLLADMQQRLPTPSTALPVRTETSPRPLHDDVASVSTVVAPFSKPDSEKGSDPSPKKRSSSSTSKARKRSSAKKPTRKAASKQPSSLFQKHTPTIHKALTGIFRRS